MPERILTSVLLPAPLSPQSATTSPACTDSDTPASDWTPPNHLTMSSQRRTTEPLPFGAESDSPLSAPSPMTPDTGYCPGGTCAVFVGVSRYLKYFLNTYAYFGLSGSNVIVPKLFACAGVVIVRPRIRRVGG